MKRERKSEWCPMACSSERDKQAILSWFRPLCDGYEPVSADVLEHVETGKELKVRALMRTPSGRIRQAVRTLGKNCTISLSAAREDAAKEQAP